MENSLIQVVQLPVIEEQLRTLKDRWERWALDAEAMVCTEDTIQVAKAFQAEMRKEFDEVESLRKAAKQAVMEPYNQFEAVYKECVTTAFQRADHTCSNKVSEVESDMKHRCEEGLRDYFIELCAVHHLEWLTYERAGIKVDMASAKAKTPKKLREQLAAFVERVSNDVALIDRQEHAPEIMTVYKATLDAADAIGTVQEYHRQVAKEIAEKEAREAAEKREVEMVRRVEALAPSAVVVSLLEKDPNEIIPVCRFTAYNAPRRVLKQVKKIFAMEGIKYE